uniref:Uncharacterized protein n=1 Tax=Aegilops tauschii subsp. strangulata TaxID=200361 RepID=A0A453PT07_AEGTS
MRLTNLCGVLSSTCARHFRADHFISSICRRATPSKRRRREAGTPAGDGTGKSRSCRRSTTSRLRMRC